MKTASAEMKAFLASGEPFCEAELYTITLVGGYVLRYTSADTAITYGGITYNSMNIKRGAIKASVGVEVDTLDVSIYPAADATLLSTKWLAAARNGALDSADVTVKRAIMPTWGDTSLGLVWLFSGRSSEIKAVRGVCDMTVKTETELLDVKLPREYYQSGCLNTLFGTACGRNKALYAVTGSVTSSTTSVITTALTQAAGYFSLGTILFTSGDNEGVLRSVKSYSSGVFTLALPLLSAPSAGDTFIAYPGCDKTKTMCESSKFSNVLNLRGFPFIPDPETAA